KAAVAARSGLSKAQTSQALAAFIDHLQTSLSKGDKISLPGVGNFEVAARSARQGRNPQTGETMDIPACKAVKFKAGKALKDAVNG
ncbi:MAG: HU family DNA-binding protein, partial [Alphaproteobacteria bacterium]|nr:HU family DNA-binding protein [Alphaproteobacteria bacterium]